MVMDLTDTVSVQPVDIVALLRENERRKEAMKVDYDPERGIGCFGARRAVEHPFGTYLVPRAMTGDAEYSRTMAFDAFERLRIRYDFEYWAWRVVKIRDKLTGDTVPLRLNAGQRKMLAVMESERLARRPVRVILLKARQWGGSTLVTLYFAWIQLVVRRRWNILLAAHVLNTAALLRSNYADLLRNYPEELWLEEVKPRLKGVPGTSATRRVPGREATLAIGSAHAPASLRGLDASMAHLSEVAFWIDSPKLSAADTVRAMGAGIPLAPDTVVVMESTANGTGNFFHQEWLRAKDGKSDKTPVFVAWHEIDMNAMPVRDPLKLWNTLDAYEQGLWRRGLTLEQIAWYKLKRREVGKHELMMAEYPTDDLEAFTNSDCAVFAAEHVAALRDGCEEPAEVGELCGAAAVGPSSLVGLHFVADSTGGLKIWRRPRDGALPGSYVVAVDVGGRSAAADWSVIAVLDRHDPLHPEIVAQWRGHIDHDHLAWKAAGIAAFYAKALLVVESNTLETESAGASTFILEQLARHYPRLYARTERDTRSPHPARRYGFHTNRATKATIMAGLIQAVRDHSYTERDTEACGEMSTYIQLPSGAYRARASSHDDVLMTRAILLYVAQSTPAPTASAFAADGGKPAAGGVGENADSGW